MPFTIEEPAQQNKPEQPATPAPAAGNAGFRLEMPNREPAAAARPRTGFTLEQPTRSAPEVEQPQTWRDFVVERPPADDSWANIIRTEFQNLPKRFENAYLGVMSSLRNEMHDPEGINKWLHPFKGYQAEARHFTRALRSDPENPGLRAYAEQLGADPDLLLNGDWREQLEQSNKVTQGFRAVGVAADEGLQSMLQEAQSNTEAIADNTVDLPTWSAKGLARDTLVGVQEMAPAVLAGILTRNLGVGAQTGAAVMGAQAYGRSYLDALQGMELPHELAQERAGIFALAEFATEAIPLKTILSDTKRLNKILQSAYEEGVQEGVTEILQQGYDFLRLDEDITFPEFIEGVAHSVVVGAGVGGSLAAITPGGGTAPGEDEPETDSATTPDPIETPPAAADPIQQEEGVKVDPETGEVTGGRYSIEPGAPMDPDNSDQPDQGQLDEYQSTATEITPEITPDAPRPPSPREQDEAGRQVPAVQQDARPENATPTRVETERDDLPAGFVAVDFPDANRYSVETKDKPENFRQLSAIARQKGGRYSRQKGYEPSFVFDTPQKREDFISVVKGLEQARVEREQSATKQPDLLDQSEQTQEWQQFEPATGTLGIPRDQMPQIKAEHRGALVNFLKGRDINGQIETVSAESLKPTQAEFSPAKVQKAVEFEGGERSILISSDGHVVDGHHQWLAKQGGDIQVIRFDAPIKDVLSAVSEFPSAETSEGDPSTATPEASDNAESIPEAEPDTEQPVASESETQPEAEPVPADDQPTTGQPDTTAEVIEPETEAEPVKWFGTQQKAQAWVDKQTDPAQYEVQPNGRRFEVYERPAAAAQDAEPVESTAEQVDNEESAQEEPAPVTEPVEATDDIPDNNQRDDQGAEPGSSPTNGEERGAAGRAGELSETSGTGKKRVSKGRKGKSRGRKSDPARDNDQDGTVSPSSTRNRDESDSRGIELTLRDNYRITDRDKLGQGGSITKARGNIEAIRILKSLNTEHREPTQKELKALVKYVGWGASDLANKLFPSKGEPQGTWKELRDELKALLTEKEYETAARSTQYAHYTSKSVIDSIWSGVERLGLKNGMVFEGGMGTGNFTGLIPPSMYLHYSGVEMDGITAGIAKVLYPRAGVYHGDFTKMGLPENYYDLTIGNPPFASITILNDPKYRRHKFKLHDYFIAKQIDALKPGGIAVFVTSKGTMDKANQDARQYLTERVDLLGAIRLPQTAFKENAGTEVVTDILFFQKREEGAEPGRNAWLELKPIQTKEGEAYINEYFHDNPNMVLGESSMKGSMYGPAEYTVLPNGNIDEQLAQAVQSLPQNVYENQLTAEELDQKAQEFQLAPGKTEGSYYFDDNGTLRQVTGGVGEVVPIRSAEQRSGLSAPALRVIKSYVPLRDTVLEVYAAQNDPAALAKAQEKLHTQYDQFVKDHGPINRVRTVVRKDGREMSSEPVLDVVFMDPYAYQVAMIERYDEASGEATKHQIFYEPIKTQDVSRSIESAVDALSVTLNDKGYVDLDYLAELYNTTPEAALAELGDSVYQDPATEKYLTADDYLSGNVKAKLAQAKEQGATDPKYQRNVKALEEVQPEDLPISRIPINLGAMWIPSDIVERFANEVMDFTGSISSFISGDTSNWVVSGTSDNQEFATNRRKANEVLAAALNRTTIKVYDSYYEDGNKKQELNKEETAAANQKVQDLKDKFQTWLLNNDEAATSAHEIYNARFNTNVPRKYDGSHLTLPRLSSRYTPHAWQKNAVWRIITNGNTYMAHTVGSGKTLTSAIAAIELKRLGLVKKPTFSVLKSTLKQFAMEFLDAYPDAKVLIADERQLDRRNLKRFYARLTAENWDAVVLSHQAFEKIAMSDEFIASVVEEELDEYRELLESVDEEDRAARKQVERQIEAMEQRLEAMSAQDRKIIGIPFEETGIDFVFVDEAHHHKKIPFPTNQSNIKGVDPTGSNIAYDMYLKSKYLNRVRPGRALTLMSGTPVTNTVGEVFNIQRYLQPEVLKNGNISSFDTWSATFTTTVTELEMQPSGTFKPSTRLAKFVGVPALMRDFLQVADVVTDADLNESVTIKRPAIRGGQRQIVTVPRSPELKDYQSELATRISKLEEKKGPPKKGEDNILVVIGDAKKASIDLRLVGRPQNTPSKLDFMIDDVFKSWRDTSKLQYRSGGKFEPQKGATQLIFTEIREAAEFDIYNYIKDRLVQRGVPSDQIAFIQDYGTTKKKKKLFREMNTGVKRILLGGSKNLGTGTNVQQRLYDINHLDIDYLPANIVQREGRGIRQGNKNEDVGLRAYATEGTVDAFMWQLNETKQRMIDQVMSGNLSIDEVEDISDSASQMAQAKALSSGNPLLLEQAGLTAEVTKLRALRDAHRNQNFANQKRARELYREIAGLKELQQELAPIVGKYRSTAGDKFKMTIFGKSFTDRKKAGDYIQATIASQEPGRVGSIAGFDLILSPGLFKGSSYLSFIDEKGKTSMFDTSTVVRFDEETDSVGLVKRIENQARKLTELPDKITESIAVAEKRRAIAEQQATTVFQYSDDLKLKETRLAEITAELSAQPEESNSEESAADESSEENNAPNESGDSDFKRSVRAPNFYSTLLGALEERGFYSALLKTVEQAKGAPNSATAAQWISWLDGRQMAGELRKAERDWLGVDAWLSDRERTTREELADYVRANQIQIEEVSLADATYPQGSYMDLMGGEVDTLDNWRKRLQEVAEAEEIELDELLDELEDVSGDPIYETDPPVYAGYQLPEGEQYQELLLRLPPDPDRINNLADSAGITYRAAENKLSFRSDHWEQDNILAHVRFNVRTDANGDRVLFLEEIQSDWHQQGRRGGYFDTKKPWEVYNTRDGKSVARFATAEEAMADVQKRGSEFDHAFGGEGLNGGVAVPEAPFKATDAWSMLAFKRMVRWAAEHGINKIAWTTGEQQADRYDLSKSISRITYTKAKVLRSYDHTGQLVQSRKLANDDQLADMIGKDAAQNLLNNPVDAVPGTGLAGTAPAGFMIEGADLKMGGEGMTAYYDGILPSAVNKWAKKFGGRVVQKAGITDSDKTPLLEVTPMMREAAMQGLPLFSRQPNPAPGTSRQAIEQAFSKSPLSAAISAAIDSGRVVLHDTGLQMPGWEEGTQAITMPDGTIHLAADQLRADEAVPVLMHEAFHSGADAFLGTKAWGALNRRLASLYDQGARSTGRMRQFWQAAQDRIAKAEAAGDKMNRKRRVEEFGAYAIEEYESAPRAVRKWFDDLIAAIKKWILKFFGRQVGDVTPGQLASIAASALRTGAVQSNAQGVPSRSVKPSGQTNTEEFKRWFGDSKVVDEKGEPLVVYHSTTSPDNFSTFTPSNRGTLGKGIYFTSDLELANMMSEIETGRIMPVFVSLKNPYEFTLNEEMEIEYDFDSAAVPMLVDLLGDRKAKEIIANNDDFYLGSEIQDELLSRGHDGIILTFDNGDKEYLAFNPEQVKSAIGNRGTFDPNDSDIRRSVRRPDPAKDIAQSIKEARSPSMLKKMGWRIIDYRSNGLYFLGRNHLVEIGSKVLPTMKVYLAQAKRMDAYRNSLLSDKAQPAEKWRKYAQTNKAEAQELSDLMHDATIAGVDPAEAYVPLTDPKTTRDRIKVLKQKARDRSGEGTAKWMDQIKKEKNKLKQERNRAMASGDLYERWNKLSPEAKDIYVTVRDAYSNHQAEVLNALIQRIEENITSEKHRKALIDALRVQFENNRVEAPYFPLSRFGEYWVRVNDVSAPMNEPDYSFHMFESKSEQEVFIRSFENDPTVTITHGKKLEAHKEMARISPGFVTDVQLLLDKAGSGPTITGIKDEIYQLYLTSLPDLSVRKHFIHRGKIEGYSRDAIRAFSHFMFHGSYQLARLKYAHRLENLLEEMRSDIGVAGNQVVVEDLRNQAWAGEPGAAQRVHNIEAIESDPDAATDFLNELQKRHDWAMNPKGSKTAQFLTSFGFVFYLGVSPAAAMVNLTQTPIVALPTMGAKWGMAKSTAALSKAMADFFRGGRRDGGFSVSNVLNGDEKAAFKALEDSGILDKTLGHDLAGMSEQGFEYNSTAHRVMNVVSFFFHHAERFNREITALASYRLARSAGKSHMAAVQAAADVTETSHFDYSSSNKARLLQSDTARVLLLFRQYSLNVTYLLARSAHQSFKGDSKAVKVEARRRLTGILGMTAIFAGLQGLPLFWVVKFVLETMFDDEDEPWEFDAEFRQFLVDMTGSKTAAAVLARGPIDVATGATISSRVSLNNLWIRESYRDLEGQAAYQYWLEQLAGPIGGTAAGGFRWAQLMDQGEYGRAFEAMLPVFMRNALKAWRFDKEGANTMRGDPLIEEMPNNELFMQVLGFTPTSLSERYAENSAIKNVEQRILDRRSKLLDRFALTTRLGDEGGTEEVLVAIQRFNTANPTMAIKNETLIQSIRSRQSYSDRAQNGIIINKNLQHLVEKYDFAD